MSDLLEQELREALDERAARVTPEASARLRAVEYRPHTRWRPRRRVAGAAGLGGLAAAAGAVVLLASSAAPAFAGWTPSPTPPQPGELSGAQQACGSGSPVLTDTRGPYTAAIYANGSTCIDGNGIRIGSVNGGDAPPSPSAGTIQLNGLGEKDSNGNALTMVDGPVGAGVTGVTITRSDGTSVQATVENGWYLAWWPGTERAVTARVATASGTATQSFPAQPVPQGPACPTGAHCASGYGFGAAPTHGASTRTMSVQSSSATSGQVAGGSGGQ